MDSEDRLVESQPYGFGNAYPDANPVQKVLFHIGRRAFRISFVYRFLHEAFYYLGAVFEFDPGPFAVMMRLNTTDIYEPWSELFVHCVPAWPATGSWPSRLRSKLALVVLGVPLLMIDRRGAPSVIALFQLLARRGAFWRTFI
jgi:hypothetical protein